MSNYVQKLKSRDVVAVYVLISALQAVGISFSTPVYVVFLLSFGITPLIVNRINTWFMVASVGLEIPTGVLGDMFGHRRSVIAGLFCWAIGTAIYGISSDLHGFLLAETMAAFGSSFISGSFEAWMVNASKQKQLEAHSRSQIWSRAATIVGLPFVTVIADQLGLQLPWFIGASILFATGIAAWWLMQETASACVIKRTFRSVTTESFAIALHHPAARLLILGSGLTTLAFQGINMFWAPLFEGYWGVAPLGTINAGINIAMMFGAYLARKWWQRHYGLGPTAALLWMVALLLVGLLIGSPVTLVMGFVLHEVGRGLLPPLFKKLLNDHIPDHIRASTLSIAAMSDKFFAAIGLELSGRVITAYSITAAWWLSLLPLMLAAGIFYLAHKANGIKVSED